MDRLAGAFEGGAAAKKQAAANKKLKKFMEKGASLSSRFKSLTSYLEKASEEDLRKFFNENFYVIYGVFLDSFSAYENQCRRGKHEAAMLKDLLTVLKAILVYLTDYVKKGWQIRSIATVLEKVLYIENKHMFRKMAFDLLMQFLEVVHGREEAQTDLLGAAINLHPLAAKLSSVNLMTLPLSAPDKTCILLPSSGSPTVQDAVELLEVLLSYLDNADADIFLFWWDLFKAQYLCVFYPSIFPVKTCAGKIGFPRCPEDVQAAFIPRLRAITQKKSLSEALWKTEDDKQLLLEVFRQSASLPMSYDETIKTSMDLFHFTYFESPPPAVSPDELLAYRTVYVKTLAGIITSKTVWDSAEGAKKHDALCLDIVGVFKNMFMRGPDRLDPSTRETVFYTLLDTAAELLAPSTANPHLAETLHSPLLDTILLVWVLTRTRNPAHWERLCATVAALFHTMETVSVVSGKVMQMTMVVLDKIYYIKTAKKEKTAKRPGMMGGEQSAKHMEPKSPDYVCAPTLPARDDVICAMEWTVEEALFVWRRILQIFDTSNDIRAPAIHYGAMKTLWQIISAIMWREDSVPYAETREADRPEFLSVIDIFGPLLFAACDLPDAFVDGKAEAYKILCRVFCRAHIRPLPLFLLSHFYSAVQQGLSSRDSKSVVQNEILRHSSSIFSLALPGANTLLPYYLMEARRVLTGEGRPNDVKERAAIVLGSLVCMSAHFRDVEVPIGGEKSKLTARENSNIHDFLRIAGASSGRGGAGGGLSQSLPSVAVAPLPFSSLLSEVLSIATEAVKVDHMDTAILVRLLWVLCVCVVEMVHTQPSQSLTLSGVVLLLLKHLSGQPRVVMRAAIHSVASLAYVADKIRGVDAGIVSTVVESVASNILREMSEFRSNKTYAVDEALLSDQLYCLLEWAMAFGDGLCNDAKLLNKVCEALQTALTEVVRSDFPPRVAKAKGRSSRMFGNSDESLQEMYSLLVNVDPASVLLPQVRDSAENVILHLLHFLHNTPAKEGIDVLTSLITHTDDVAEDAKAFHFVYNDSVLYTLVEVPRKGQPERRFARVIVRDSIGKHAWDTDVLFDYDATESCLAVPFPFAESESDSVADLSPQVRSAPRPLSPDSDPSQAPLHTNTYSEKTDQLDLLLRYLSHSYPDCLPESGQVLNVPADCQEAQKARIDYTETALVAQIEEDTLAMRQMIESVPPSHSWQMESPAIPTPIGPSHHCRLLLSHLGFLVDENVGNLALLSGENEKILRSLNQLDITNSREQVKVGLIYLREGQEEQIEVLRNDSSCRSHLFYEFVRSIGWPIDVQTHRAYLAGLDPKLTTGVTAPYYATSTFEMIFHDLTSMPTTDEAQQIHKKRHVGNDNVHVIWTEHVRDYNPETIKSEFNDAHIVVYPLSNGLFKIHIFQKENVEVFGPLLHGMVISKEILPVLIRSTCMMANKYVRYTMGGYVTPYANRKRVLNQIIERHKDDTDFRDLIGCIT